MLFIVALLLYALGTDGKCADNEFASLETGGCKPCTDCLPGQLLSRRCSENSDTQCGVGNFSFQNNKPVPTQGSETVVDEPPFVVSNKNQEYWRNLAFALIGVLSFFVVLTTIVVLVACYRFRSTGWFCKRVTGLDPEDVENGYVVIHKFIPVRSASPSNSPPPSPTSSPDLRTVRNSRLDRHIRRYRPKRRLMNEYVDDVFESEDSAGSRTLKLPLATIPEKGEGS